VELSIDQVNEMIAPRFPGMVGVRFTELAPGRSVCELTVRGQLHNPAGVLHGGVHYTLADTGMAMALWPMLDADLPFTTIEIKMSYFKAVTGGTLVCTTTVVNKGRRIAFLESEIRDGARIVAKASGTYYIAAP